MHTGMDRPYRGAWVLERHVYRCTLGKINASRKNWKILIKTLIRQRCGCYRWRDKTSIICLCHSFITLFEPAVSEVCVLINCDTPLWLLSIPSVTQREHWDYSQGSTMKPKSGLSIFVTWFKLSVLNVKRQDHWPHKTIWQSWMAGSYTVSAEFSARTLEIKLIMKKKAFGVC